LPVDLHIHSWHSSDSLARPSKIVERALELGISALAITDHDTTAGLEEACTAARSAAERGDGEVEIVPAAEISATFRPTGEAVHLVALFIDPCDGALVDLMDRARAAELTNFHLVLEGLAERGLEISEGSVIDSFEARHPGVPWGESRYFYLYHYLVDSGAATNESSARSILQKVIAGKHSCIEAYPMLFETIAAIRSAGGVAVLAHPAHYSFTGDALRKVLRKLVSKGLGGLEALHRAHSIEDRAAFATLARSLGLVITGGSDSHDPINDPVFGRLGVPDAVLEEIRRLASG